MNKNIKTFVPVLGVIVHKESESGNHYLQVHSIASSEEKFVWGEGKPFQKEQLQELAIALRNEQLSTIKLKGILPENLLYYQPAFNGTAYAWYLMPDHYHLCFNKKQIKHLDGKYKMPGLVLGVCDNDIYIYAFKGKEKPTGKTELFNAPFYNVYEDGEVCMGNISEFKKKEFLHEEISRWERRFFGGRFTDAHGEDQKLAKGYTLESLYKLLKSGKQFPEAALRQAPYKNVDLFIKMIGGKND